MLKEYFCDRHWYHPSLTLLTFFLLPFSWLFRLIVAARRFLYRFKFKKSYRFPVPVIVVGNLTVGGTGKTPFVIWLVNDLREQGYVPGIVSRGVGGKQYSQPYWVNTDAAVCDVGDEAILLAKRAQCPVVICIDRVAAVRELLAKSTCNIVISDDGLQHYRLARDYEINIIDGMRSFGNQQLLPAGPLREPVSRLKSVDCIVQNGAVISAFSGKTKEIVEMTLVGDTLVSVANEAITVPLQEFIHKRIHAVAAIGNPKRFFNMLREKGFEVIEHAFPDHAFFSPEDLNFADDLPIVMTEKDAVKCQQFASKKLWYLPVTVNIPQKQAEHFSLMTARIKE